MAQSRFLRGLQLVLALVVGTAALGFGVVSCQLTPRSPGPAARAVAPAFQLPGRVLGDDPGTAPREISLSGLLQSGPAVVVFYRGYW